MSRPCSCDRYTPGREFAPGRDCPKCWMFAHRSAVRRAWGGDPAACVPLPPLPLPPEYAPTPTDPPAGVVIGAYKWPRLIDLQIRLIRRTCGPVPVLVSDDCSPGFPLADRYAELQAVCAEYPDVDVWPNVARIGHTGGDLAAFWKGVIWGRARRLKVVAKLSQRCLFTATRWLHDGADDLLASGLPLSTRRCRGVEVFDLRTEACLLDVARWHRPDVLAAITPRTYGADAPGGATAEAILNGVLRDHLGGLFWPWRAFDEERYRPTSGLLWHCANPTSEYHRLAAAFGLTLDADFHTDGWQNDRTYLYG